MPPPRRFPTLVLALALAMLGAGGTASGQEADNAPAAELDAATIEQRIAKLKNDEGLEASIRDALVTRYEEALRTLAKADADRKQAADYRQAIESAPDETVNLQRQLEELSKQGPPPDPEPGASPEELRKQVEAARAKLSQVQEDLANADGELTRMKGRPVEIGTRLPLARGELEDARSQLAADPGELSPGRLVERTELEAKATALSAEIERLEQERLSQSARESLTQARRDLLAARVKRESAALKTLEEALKKARMSEADRLEGRVSSLGPEDTGGSAARLQELQELSTELRTLTSSLQTVDHRHDEVSAKRSELNQEYRRIQEQARLGALEGGFAQLIAELRRRLANPRSIQWSIDHRAKEIRKLRLEAFNVEEKLREQDKLEELPAGAAGSLPAETLALRRQLLEQLEAGHTALIRDLAQLDAEERGYHDLILEVRSYLNRKLFWQPSSPHIGREFFQDMPDATLWTFGTERWREGGVALAGIPRRHPILTVTIALVVVALMAFRRRIIRSLEHSGKRIRRVSTDRYVHTLRALLDSLLLAAPLPLVVGFVAWALLSDPGESDWVRGVAQGLAWAAVFLAGLIALREIARPNGLGTSHFGWSPHATQRLRKALFWLAILFLPAELIASTTLFEDSSRYFDSLGRLAFMLAMLWIAVIFAWLLQREHGLFAEFARHHPDHFLHRTRALWFTTMVGAPLVLSLMAAVGYVFTALSLSMLLQGTLRVIAIGVVAYGLALRWFMIKERRIALEEALAARRARRDAAASASEKAEDEDGKEVVSVEQAEAELDLAALGLQTRRLLISLTAVGIAILVWLLWSKGLPVDDSEPVVSHGGLSLLGVARLVLIGAVAVTMVRNLPGLLDLAGLRKTGMDPGTRYAVATIAQYLVIAAAGLMIFRTLDLDWAQFGWIAAALSVGLGFGLQEIVANFVCGIILLFERPIRVGDVVTVDGVTGTVSRIRMRATTITNWDRQDFVVPNKNIVTGSLINWTLTNSVNRLTIPVGVAYGSDTGRALELLDRIARDHPLVLDDPAPLISFESFGDSTLDLVLRCYLPNMDNRLRTITELHREIDRRFAEAGIEIAFPQRDLHLRSVDAGVGEMLRPQGNA